MRTFESRTSKPPALSMGGLDWRQRHQRCLCWLGTVCVCRTPAFSDQDLGIRFPLFPLGLGAHSSTRDSDGSVLHSRLDPVVPCTAWCSPAFRRCPLADSVNATRSTPAVPAPESVVVSRETMGREYIVHVDRGRCIAYGDSDCWARDGLARRGSVARRRVSHAAVWHA